MTMANDDDKAKDARRRAVALRYNREQESAPRVVARGYGLTAERIIEIARENNIQIHEDPDLAAVLAKLDINTQVPEELYVAVAEVLAFVYRLNQQMLGR
jgi:flagellar biosynthesis protein